MKHSMLAAIPLVVSLTPLGHGQPSAANNSGLIRSAIEHRWQDEGRANEFTFIDQNHMLAGTTALITWAASDGVWLPQQMIIKGKAKEGRSIVGFETDYRYSDYKKFHSNSRIVGVPLPIHSDTLQ
jgi:hypothetical protein